jgi:polysaccharide biosynthesis/export protein ExoF
MRPDDSKRTQMRSSAPRPLGRSPSLAQRLASVAAAVAIGIASITDVVADDYRVGAQDKLKIRVFEWRPVTATAFEWVPLNGEFVVSAAGNLSLPIIGIVPAAGLTLEQVSESIGERLKTQVGMQKRPNASVEVSEYRPFFITGLVTKPGKYSYTPGLTVIQAVSMAGGTFGTLDASLIGLQRDALAGRGDLRALEVERFGLLARQARLDTIAGNLASINFPPELATREDQPLVARIMREEQDLFDARQRSLSAEIDALNQAKVLAANQIAALKSKAVTLAKQIELANKELGSVNKLASAGLTLSSREFGAHQNLADLESRDLDVALANLKAQQDVAKVDRDIADARNRYRVDALTEAAEVRDRLASNAEKAKTTRALLNNIESRSPVAATVATQDAQYTLETTIDRLVNGIVHIIAVGDNDPVAPGDVVRVEKRERATPVSTTD